MEISVTMSDTHSAADVFKSIVDKFDDLSKAYISPYLKYGPTAPVVNSTQPPSNTPQNIANPTFDRGWNVLHEAPHGIYRTTGPMHAQPTLAGNKQPIELLYAARKGGKIGPFSSVGFYGDKHLAEQARLEHHDRASAGLLKNDFAPQLHSNVEGFMAGLKATPKGSPQRGQFITSHMNHAPFQAALAAHPQGAQVKNMLNSYLNSATNAGFTPGAAKTVVKSNFEMSEDMNKTEYTAAEFFDTLRKSLVGKIKEGMETIQKAESEGAKKLGKGIGSLPSTTPSEKELHSNYLNKKAVLPHVGEEVSAEGSGGQVEKGKKLGKAALPMQVPKAPALKPAGVPAAKPTDAPKAPTAPKAPGATNPVAKAQVMGEGAVGVNPLAMSELQKAYEEWKVRKPGEKIVAWTDKPSAQSGTKREEDKHNKKLDHMKPAGELQKKAPPGFSEETMHKLKNKYGTESAFKIAWSAHEKKHGGTKKMEIPHTSTKASGGQMSEEEVMKYADEYMKKMDLPASATIPTGIKVTGNAEGVQPGEAGSSGSSGDHQYQFSGKDASAPTPKSPAGLPTTPEAALGGQVKGATVPAGPEVKGRPGATQTPEMGKMELPHTNQNANRGNVTSASIPGGPAVKGLTGAVQKTETELNKVSISPVFDAIKRAGSSIAAGVKRVVSPEDPRHAYWQRQQQADLHHRQAGGNVAKKPSETTKKMELPQTATTADGGQKSSAKVPAGPEVKGRPGAVQKTEGIIAEMQKAEGSYLTSFCNKPHRLKDGKPIGHECYVLHPKSLEMERKGDISGIKEMHSGQIHQGLKKEEMSSEETPLTEESSATEIHKGFSTGGADLNKMAMHPSPVFNVLRQGGASGMKHAMMNDPKAGPGPAMHPATPPKPMPTQAVHSQRAQQFSDFMPQGKFGKNESVSGKRIEEINRMTPEQAHEHAKKLAEKVFGDKSPYNPHPGPTHTIRIKKSDECPKCGKGITLCKC